MKLLFLDFETQGDDPATTNPTEVGALLVERSQRDGELDTYAMKAELSQLIYEEDYPAQTDEIIEITGITDEMLKKDGLPRQEVFGKMLHPLMLEADYILAHNAAFDRGVFLSTCEKLSWGMHPRFEWVCTLTDIPWAAKYKCRKLSHLAYDHGIMVDPNTLHRALDDVKLLARLVTHCHMSFDHILKYRDTPWVYLRAVIPGPWVGPGGDGGVGKAQASKLGYSWEKARGTDGPAFSKCWVKRVKENEIEAEKAKAPFKITRLMPPNETRDEI